MRLLLVEDDAALRLGLARRLEADGYRVDQAADGEDGLFQAREYPVDLAIVDLGLPKLGGLDVVQRPARGRPDHSDPDPHRARQLAGQGRAAWKRARTTIWSSPSNTPSSHARIKALAAALAEGHVATCSRSGPIAIDFSAQSARLEGEAIELTAFEYRLLEFLVRERARVVSKQELSDYLYPHDEDRDSNVLEVLIGRLRRKLDPDGTLAPIETLRGRGYRFTLG